MRCILRSLMNIHMPGKMDDSILGVQDEYLQERKTHNPELHKNTPLLFGISDETHFFIDSI